MSRRCVFLDRDGVINVSPPPGEYINAAEQFVLIPTIVDWIRLFNAMRYYVIVVTNQRGVALGVTKPDDLREIHAKMLRELANLGAQIDDVYCCPHDENACGCRKPKPGMVFAAQKKFDLDLQQSLMIGDSDRDFGLARNSGLRFVRVAEGRILTVET